MSDSTTLLEQIDSAQAQKEVTANALFDAASPATAYGRHAEACAGLTWGYYGTRYGDTAVANGTNACGASTTTYMVSNLSTGAVTFSENTTNWIDVTAYGRCYKIVTGTDTVTSYEDHRFGPGGSHSGGGVGEVTISITISDLTATTDNFMQAKDSVWASRTVAEVSVDLQATGLVEDAVGFRNIPQNSKSANYTTVAADSGKHLLHPSADTSARTFTIDSNANVAYPIGTAITIVNQNGAGVITIAITSDTMRLAGPGTTGSRTLAANGIATALKVTATEWIISGTGLT